MKNDDTLPVLKTSDFNLASTLYCLGFDIAGIDKTDLRRVIFIYKRTSDLEVALKKYWGHEIRVDPLDFDRSQKEIKAQINTD